MPSIQTWLPSRKRSCHACLPPITERPASDPSTSQGCDVPIPGSLLARGEFPHHALHSRPEPRGSDRGPHCPLWLRPVQDRPRVSRPLLGHLDVISRDVIAGWAADPAHPRLNVPLRLMVNGHVTELSGGQTRNDLKALFQDSTGEYGFRVTDNPLPLSPFVESRVEVTFAATGQLVPGGRATIPPLGSPLAASARTSRMPIVVTTTGRAGSSLLMARLARHPDVLVGRDHPYELKLLSYYTLALNTLMAKADRQRSTRPDNMLPAAPARSFFVGYNPFHEGQDCQDPKLRSFWEESSPDILRECFVSLIEAYYGRVAQLTNKPNAPYFAEKIGTSDLARRAANFMYGTVHEIMLVRDPRDVICSAGSFWKRSIDDSISALRVGFDLMMRPRIEPGLRQYVLRYEDLVLEPSVAMDRVFTFLGLSSGIAPDQDAEAQVFRTHGTSASPESTVGRWRRELGPDRLAVVNREFAAFLDQFGYRK